MLHKVCSVAKLSLEVSHVAVVKGIETNLS